MEPAPQKKTTIVPIESARDVGWAAVEAVLGEAHRLGGSDGWPAYFARNSLSFRFASRLFPPEHRRVITGVYAFCRFTDDLVDEGMRDGVGETRARLRAWLALARIAWSGRSIGVPLLDDVVGEAGRSGVPFGYIEQLIRGMEMDLTVRSYASIEDLRLYTYRAASVVGGWITEWLGVHDPEILDRAYALGHAMQMTNIARDVGEDLKMGRLYLPLDLLYVHGLTRRDLERATADPELPLPEGFPEMLERFLTLADAEYDRAVEAIPALPREVQRPIAVAADVYRGIQDEIRSLRYDSLRHRAHTSLARKTTLAAQALAGLERRRRSSKWARRAGSSAAP